MTQPPLDYGPPPDPERRAAWIVLVILFALIFLVGGPLLFYYSIPSHGNRAPLLPLRDPTLMPDPPPVAPSTQP